LAELYIEQLVDGAQEVFAALALADKELHIVSGGIRQAILPLAQYLGLSQTRVHAVDINFNKDGSYRDYNQNSPLARSGGKAEICRQLLKSQGSLVMVGDGKTDMEAKQAGACVIGFGGVVDRQVVREQADFYCAGPSLTAVLAHIF
jgi:phosphoserine phosphatase